MNQTASARHSFGYVTFLLLSDWLRLLCWVRGSPPTATAAAGSIESGFNLPFDSKKKDIAENRYSLPVRAQVLFLTLNRLPESPK